MTKTKQSFLSNIVKKCEFCKDIYDGIRTYSLVIILTGTILISVFVGLSFFVYWHWLSKVIDLLMGTSLVFILYVIAVISILDIQVAEEVQEKEYDLYSGQEIRKKVQHSIGYKLTIVWGITLMLLGVVAIYGTNKFRKHYSFQTSYFLVDQTKGIYHLDYDNDCEAKKNAFLKRMQGYEFEDLNYQFCVECEEWLDDAMDSYESDRYYRK